MLRRWASGKSVCTNISALQKKRQQRIKIEETSKKAERKKVRFDSRHGARSVSSGANVTARAGGGREEAGEGQGRAGDARGELCAQHGPGVACSVTRRPCVQLEKRAAQAQVESQKKVAEMQAAEQKKVAEILKQANLDAAARKRAEAAAQAELAAKLKVLKEKQEATERKVQAKQAELKKREAEAAERAAEFKRIQQETEHEVKRVAREAKMEYSRKKAAIVANYTAIREQAIFEDDKKKMEEEKKERDFKRPFVEQEVR